tara:strand:+ start:252 stop:488 length:237 start_codon:yes stop_codon:yes gene_type:complete
MKVNIINLGLADWISDQEPNYPSFDECKNWIECQFKDKELVITEKDEEVINMLLKYIPMSQIMNKKIISCYLDGIIKK